MNRKLTLALAAAAISASGAAVAHDHYVITGNGEQVVLAGGNGTHGTPMPTADGWIICGGDPAGYGLEVAHHGPDASGAGNSDDCYMIEGGVHPRDHDGNPAID